MVCYPQMNVLLIEDDPHKGDRIAKYLQEVLPQVHLKHVRSYQTGMHAIVNGTFDLILLDMSLPVYEVRAGESGFDAPSFAGEDILEEMRRKSIPGNVVVITGFETF